MQDPRVIVALDYPCIEKALEFVDKIEPGSCHLKVGKEMFTLYGPEFVRQLQNRGHTVFLDLKFHDIPNTCARAVMAAAELGVWMVNVHACGGERMMLAAREALEPYGKDKPLLIGVTVLTSMEKNDLVGTGILTDLQDHVMRLGSLAHQCGLNGLVCSAHESEPLKTAFGTDFKLVTPGIRLSGAPLDDQRRIMTPIEALQAGSDFLVIGRPLTQAKHPAEVLAQINESLK